MNKTLIKRILSVTCFGGASFFAGSYFEKQNLLTCLHENATDKNILCNVNKKNVCYVL